MKASRSIRGRSGFTLVEMLVTITIIAILAGVALGVMGAAQNRAREHRTRATVLKIYTLIMDRWDSYRTRRLALSRADADTMASTLASQLGLDMSVPADRAKARAWVQVNARRDLVRMEMPDRTQDILTDPVSGILQPNLQRVYRSWFDRKRNDPTTGAAFQELNYIEAEILYVVVTAPDPEARERFSDSEVADTDGDGAVEFVDAWGNPIMWIRWPVAFADSEIQGHSALADHDPFDPMRVDDDAFRTIPLVYSPGADGIYDLNVEARLDYAAALPIDPYAQNVGQGIDAANTSKTATGAANGTLDHFDNIHSHYLKTR